MTFSLAIANSDYLLLSKASRLPLGWWASAAVSSTPGNLDRIEYLFISTGEEG
jgi:hypothetical protein